MTSVGTMEYKRCKLPHEVVRCPPDVNVRVRSDGDVPNWLLTQASRKEMQYKLSVRRKGNSLDWTLKVEMVQDYCSLKIHQQSSAVCTTCRRLQTWRNTTHLHLLQVECVHRDSE